VAGSLRCGDLRSGEVKGSLLRCRGGVGARPRAGGEQSALPAVLALKCHGPARGGGGGGGQVDNAETKLGARLAFARQQYVAKAEVQRHAFEARLSNEVALIRQVRWTRAHTCHSGPEFSGKDLEKRTMGCA
jgi:hypothetical protein